MKHLVKRIRFFLIALVLSSGGVFADEGESMTAAEVHLDKLERRAQASDARVVRFRESRRFPFRSKPVELGGIVRIDKQQGTSIEYPEKDIAIIVDENGMVLRQFKSDNSFQDRELPARQSESGKLLSLLFEFDKAALLEAFEVEASGDKSDWMLSLTPKHSEATKLEAVEIQSDEQRIHSIDIQLQGRRGFLIEPTEEEERHSFSEEELNRYFR